MRDRARSSAIGRSNQKIGERFEDWLDDQHVEAGRQGILAHVVHNEAKSKIVRGRHIYSGAGVADYTGMLDGGRYFAAEAKSTANKRLEKNAISTKQQEHLESTLRGGGLALLLVEFRSELPGQHRRYAVRWESVPWRMLRTAESVGEYDFADAWLIAPGASKDCCYLSKYHSGSERKYFVGVANKRVYPSE